MVHYHRAFFVHGANALRQNNVFGEPFELDAGPYPAFEIHPRLIALTAAGPQAFAFSGCGMCPRLAALACSIRNVPPQDCA